MCGSTAPKSCTPAATTIPRSTNGRDARVTGSRAPSLPTHAAPAPNALANARAATSTCTSTTTPRSALLSMPGDSRIDSDSPGERAMANDRLATLQHMLERNPDDTRARFGLPLEYEKLQ